MRTTLFVLCAAGWLRADTVLLRNGQRIEGRILGGTADTVMVRRGGGTGGTYVEKIDRANVARIERDSAATRPAPVQPAPVRLARSAAATASAPVSVMSPDELPVDMKRSLIVAIAKWRAEDFAGAGMDLSRLINSAKAEQREAISEMARGLTQNTLAELAADTHFRAASATRRGSAVRLPYVTEYEKQALIPMLVTAYERALSERDSNAATRVQTPDTPRETRGGSRPTATGSQSGGAASQPWYTAYAQTRPAAAAPVQPGDAPAIIDWIGRPQAFDGTIEQAQSLLSRVHLATSLLNERLRLDPALRRNAELKRGLLADKQRLVALGKALAAYSPGQSEEPDEAAVTEAAKTRREELEKRMQEAQKAEAKRIQDARDAARKWQEEQDKKNSKGWFDWLKPAEQNRPAQPAPTAPPAESPK